MAIVIDEITTQGTTTNSVTITHRVNSPDSVLVVFVSSQTNGGIVVSIAGQNLTQLVTTSGTGASTVDIWYTANPPVGSVSLLIQSGAGGKITATAISLIGVNKLVTAPVTFTDSSSGGASASNNSINVSSANSMILDYIGTGNVASIETPSAEQTQLAYNGTNGAPVASSFMIAQPGTQSMNWTWGTSSTRSVAAVVFEPSASYSIWRPTSTLRNPLDVVGSNGLNIAGNSISGQFGYHPATFFQNSFLHTVGRELGGIPLFVPSITNGWGQTTTNSRIVIDKITEAEVLGSSITFDHNVSSLDAVLVVLATGTANNIASIQVNGVKIPALPNTNQSGFSNGTQIIFVPTPDVGVNTIVVTGASMAGMTATAITLLGVDKSNPNIISNLNTAGSGTSESITAQIDTPNSMIIDCIMVSAGGLIADSSQTTIQNNTVSRNFGVSFKIVSVGLNKMSWSFASGSWATAYLVLRPAKALSIWSTNDITESASPISGNTWGNYPSNFYLNSFLHTIGRKIISPTVVVPTIPGETEQPTSQIIVDKVYQGQVASLALSTVSLTMDINIPSSDAVLVVTGGSVIATGAAWADVSYNGNKLTNLIQAITTGADSEIWYLPNPPTGTGQLTITSGTGGEIYANAMVILGVDKSNNGIIATSTVDGASTSTITNLITPDVDNCLIIDCLSTLNATQAPVADLSQTQVFNASALASNEYVLSTYKLGSNSQQNTNYNLGVAVNATLVSVALRPAHAPSMWFPNIDLRTIDDVVTVAGLDSEVNPSFGQYGYKGSTFYKNGFLHTVGRMFNGGVGIITSSLTTRLLMTGVGM